MVYNTSIFLSVIIGVRVDIQFSQNLTLSRLSITIEPISESLRDTVKLG